MQKELREIDKDKSSGVSVRVMAESNLSRLQGCIQGTMATPIMLFVSTFNLSMCMSKASVHSCVEC